MRRPGVVARQRDVVPAQRREVSEQIVIDRKAVHYERVHRPLQITSVPQHDCGYHQVESRVAVLLVLVAAIAQLSESVEEYCPRQSVRRVALAQSHVHTPAQCRALQPLQREQRPLGPDQLPERQNIFGVVREVLRRSTLSGVGLMASRPSNR